MIAIEQLDDEFSICKVADYSQVDLTLAYFFIGKTDEENSLLCPTNKVPKNTLERNDGWRAFRIQGVLNFSLIGILSKISTLLAENKIGIFAISTFNTDYIFIKKEKYDLAMQVLKNAGYEMIK